MGFRAVFNGDWRLGITAARILRNETHGWQNGVVLHGGSIVAGHDGSPELTPFTIAAMPGIVRWMNAHQLGATATVPADATGGDLLPRSSEQNTGTG